MISTPTPTLYLRFIEREVLPEWHPTHPDSRTFDIRTVRILQQFWGHPDGKEVCGDVYGITRGSWRDVPVEKP